ncbi:MAG: ABC transporter ATP-binding protein [Chloroflexi bacterium]|nr:ABC transporter ATP-binding protein [Chloroflexota bacterium]MCY3583640.1 ABC transporter ATP-binding protein [Chloroflexota bacterium]MCY3717184.1 ABC transporter ATP-binding protein [Chloroflexota bacterium]MDE2651790.1 ABC transporter ATP-binding protein [Chloroflexota bacterium]MXX52137.1 ABC transporter ATP-binding protein [Chloroflexota bacterium]
MRGGGWFRYMHSANDAKPNVTRALLLRVLAYARPYRRQIAGMLATILLTTALGLLNPLIFREIIDGALAQKDMQRLHILALGLVAIPVASGAVRIVQRKLNVSIGEGVIYDLRVALYHHLQQMSLRFFTNTKTGELMSRLNNDVVGAQNAISNTIVSIITNVITVAATLAVMLSMEWRLTILGVLVLPCFVFIARRLGRRLKDIAREQMSHNAQMNAMMNETLNISGALLVKLFGRIDQEVAHFEERAADVRDAGILRAVLGSQFFVMIGLVSVVGTALVYWVGGILVIQDAFTVGTIVAFGAYLTQLYTPLQALTNAPVDFAQSIVSFERVFEIIDLPLDIAERDDAVKLEAVRGALHFDEVTFRYMVNEEQLLSDVERVGRMDNVAATRTGRFKRGENGFAAGGMAHQARELALDGLTFRIEPGQLVALVGPSGAGKTTLTYLIPRLYDPTSGRIRLDGYDLRELSLATLADSIGMVTQETYLFHDSIRTNLLYAKPDASDAEIVAAARIAHIHDFIMGLGEDYDSIVGERGYRLSGGEKQRIAIARVVLKDPRILVLDEATSHLDSQSEALIQDALSQVMQGRTSIVIAHRLSTILAADKILVLDRGAIVEHGNHEELLRAGGLYARLYETQFSQQGQRI